LTLRLNERDDYLKNKTSHNKIKTIKSNFGQSQRCHHQHHHDRHQCYYYQQEEAAAALGRMKPKTTITTVVSLF